ncbi:S8 family peptidase [Flindersiella endophytica]
MLALLASGLAITTISASVPASAVVPPGSGSDSGNASAHRGEKFKMVTLITGDRVRLVKGAKGYAATASPGPGRDGVVFGTERRGDSLWVFPSDAVSLVASGRLDRRLFEVSQLAEDGYSDNVRKTIPLIVQHSKGKQVSTLPKGAATSRELASVESTAVQQKKQSATAFWKWLTGSTKAVPGKKQAIAGAYAGDVRKVWLDGKMKASLDRSVPQIGAPEAWKKGYTGKNVKVAVLDTGIDTAHLDLKGAVLASKDFSGSGSVIDHFGHGTHVASIITGDGARSGGKYKGVAPDAKLLNGKVLDDFGSGSESTVIAGMEWAVAQQAKVVNLSLGGGPTDGTDIVDVALNELSLSSGTLFVVAAGNYGPDRYTVTTPSSANEALSVAATNRNQTTADFSSAGPRIGDFAVKPEIAAPGRDIVAARAAGTELGPIVSTYYTSLSGTSMATPHVAGAAAILAQQQPTWNARLLKSALMGTSRLPVNESVFRQGAGFLDVARAVNQKVFTLEGSLSANLQWPHTQKATRTLTYRNPGASPLTLSLAFRPVDQNGAAPAAGVFSMPNTVTVPARSTAKVTLTIDPTKSRPGLLYQGRITATATGIYVRTPVSVNVEQEAYDVSLDITDRNGDKVTGLDQGQLFDAPYLINAATGESAIVARPKDGKWVARVPRGAYTVALQVLTLAPSGSLSQTTLAVPRITATAPVALTLDARQGKQVTAKVDGASPVTQTIGTALAMDIQGIVWGSGVQVTDLTAQPEAFAVGVASFGRPAEFSLFQEISTTAGSYDIPYTSSGSIPDGLEYAVADSQLAEVNVSINAHNVKAVGDYLRDVFFGSPEFFTAFGSSASVTTPTARTYRVLPEVSGQPTEWYSTLWANQPSGEWAYDEFLYEGLAYEAGKQYAVKLSAAAWSPQGTGAIWSDNYMEVDFGPFDPSGGSSIYPYPEESVTGDWVLKRGSTTVATSATPWYVYTERAVQGATYTAVMHAAKQSPWSPFVPKVSGTWVFKAPAVTEDVATLPIISTAVTGDFDKWGRAPAGRAFPITLNVTGAQGGVATATVRVSNDDGKTWTSVPVSNASGQWVANVPHPATFTNPYISLRVVVTDAQGNSGGWTATRAYKIANLG